MTELDGGWDGLISARAELSTGVTLHYVTQGEGPLVVLVHGFPEHWYGWRHQIPALVDAGFRVVAPDMRGYNLSDKPPNVEDYRLEKLGDDIGALVETLGESKAIVVGHDWGGVAAWMFAMRHPDKLAKLIVLNMPHPAVFAEAWGTLKQRLKSFYFYFFRMRRFAAFIYRRFNAFPQRLMLWWFARRKPKWKDLAPYARAGRQPGAMRSMMTYYTALLRRKPGDIELTKITAPVHVIWGMDDPAFSPELAEPGDHVANVTIHRQDGLGHFLHLENPERVNTALLQALE